MSYNFEFPEKKQLKELYIEEIFLAHKNPLGRKLKYYSSFGLILFITTKDYCITGCANPISCAVGLR